ncbi:T9SS type A sorting domain-containing protein [bacterium]|nr:T9SS type A sorting domain-containing protein [bacterium]
MFSEFHKEQTNNLFKFARKNYNSALYLTLGLMFFTLFSHPSSGIDWSADNPPFAVVHCFDRHSSDSSIMYAATESFYSSTDGGISWHNIGDLLPVGTRGSDINKIYFDNLEPSSLWIAAIDLYYSNDFGRTWVNKSSFLQQYHIISFIQSPQNTNTFYAICPTDSLNYLYRTENNGQNWEFISSADYLPVFTVDPLDDSHILFYDNRAYGQYSRLESFNSGAVWDTITYTPNGIIAGRTILGYHPINQDKLYLIDWGVSRYGGLYTANILRSSRDHGIITNDIGEAFRPSGFHVSNTGDVYKYAPRYIGTSKLDLYRFDDPFNPDTSLLVFPEIPLAWYANDPPLIEFRGIYSNPSDPNDIIVNCNDLGLFRVDRNNDIVEILNNRFNSEATLPALDCRPIRMGGYDGLLLTNVIGLWLKDNNRRGWTFMGANDGYLDDGRIEIASPSNPDDSQFYINFMHGIKKYNIETLTYTNIDLQHDVHNRYMSNIITHPNSSDSLLTVFYDDILLSTDGGNRFTSVMDSVLLGDIRDIVSINSDTVMIINYNSMYMSNDFGNTWSYISENYGCNSLVYNKEDNVLFAYMKDNYDSNDIYISNDRGRNFSIISNDLDIYNNSLTYSSINNCIYVSSYNNVVVYSVNNGLNWYVIDDNIDDQYMSIDIDDDNSELLLSSWYHGLLRSYISDNNINNIENNLIVDDYQYHIYPTPANSRVIINNKNSKFINTIVLYNVLGQYVGMMNVGSNNQSIEINLESFNNMVSGYYTIRIISGNSSVTKTLIYLR